MIKILNIWNLYLKDLKIYLLKDNQLIINHIILVMIIFQIKNISNMLLEIYLKLKLQKNIF